MIATTISYRIFIRLNRRKKKMSSILLNKNIYLESVVPEPVNILKSVNVRYQYENGKRTDTIAGHVYEVVNSKTLDTFNVLVEGSKKPIVTNDEIFAKNDEDMHIFVEFENARLRLYYSTVTNKIEDSIKADGVHIVETK